jgi:hypothetical protein
MSRNIAKRSWKPVGSLKNILTRSAFSSAALGIAGALTVSLTAFTGTASAALSDCYDPGFPNTKLCMWVDANYSGGWFAVINPPVGTCQSVATGYNDLTSSIYNRTNNTLYYYQNGGCSGYLGLVSAHTAVSYVGDAANDKISSYLLN